MKGYFFSHNFTQFLYFSTINASYNEGIKISWEVSPLHRRLGIIVVVFAAMLIFTGCSSSGDTASKNKTITNHSSPISGQDTSFLKNKGKSVTDSELLNADKEDSTVNMDSLDIQVPQLSADDINTLLNDNNDVNNIPANMNVK